MQLCPTLWWKLLHCHCLCCYVLPYGLHALDYACPCSFSLSVVAMEGQGTSLTLSQVTKFEDPQEACLSVVAESYRLWLQHETRTDDITMVVIQFQGLEDEAPQMALPTPSGWVCIIKDYSTYRTALPV